MKRLPVLFVLLAASAACGDVVHTVIPDNFEAGPELVEFVNGRGHFLLGPTFGPSSEGSALELDIDGNGTEDFRVVAYTFGLGWRLEGVGANASRSRPTPGPDIGGPLVALRKGDWVGPDLPAGEEWTETIPGASSFGRPLAPYMSSCVITQTSPSRRACLGQFAYGVTAYGGLRFEINGNTHYGWVRLRDLNLGALGGGFVQEYAYETEPDTPIRIIPEPSVVGLLGTGALLLFIERRRTRFMNAGGRVPARKPQPNP